MKVTEYDVRELDQWGDAQDVNSFETRIKALVYAERIVQNNMTPVNITRAVVVERHTFPVDEHGAATDVGCYTLLAAHGSQVAISYWDGSLSLPPDDDVAGA